MPHSQSPWPFERPEQLTDLLREQGATPEECADLLPAVRRLSEWQAPQPSPADTRHLLARLVPELPALSPVRQAIREHQQQHQRRLSAGNGPRTGQPLWPGLLAGERARHPGRRSGRVEQGASRSGTGAAPQRATAGLPGNHRRLSRERSAGTGIRTGLPALPAATGHSPAGDCAGL